MDPLKIHASKTRSIKKHKSQQLLNDLILYSLTTFACTSFCSSPFWYPPFCATFNVFFSFSLPNITSFFFTSKALFIVGNLIIIFLLGESKLYASMSKSYNDVYHDSKYESKPMNDHFQVVMQPSSNSSNKSSKVVVQVEKTELTELIELKACEEDEHDEFFELCDDQGVGQMVESCNDGDEEVVSCSKEGVKVVEVENEGLLVEDLNKMVDDFIARVNRQRMLEDEFGRGGCVYKHNDR